MPVRENGRNRKRVRDIGFAGVARLTLVREVRHFVRGRDILDVGGLQIRREQFF